MVGTYTKTRAYQTSYSSVNYVDGSLLLMQIEDQKLWNQATT
jgi:hypothetical protein